MGARGQSSCKGGWEGPRLHPGAGRIPRPGGLSKLAAARQGRPRLPDGYLRSPHMLEQGPALSRQQAAARPPTSPIYTPHGPPGAIAHCQGLVQGAGARPHLARGPGGHLLAASGSCRGEWEARTSMGASPPRAWVSHVTWVVCGVWGPFDLLQCHHPARDHVLLPAHPTKRSNVPSPIPAPLQHGWRLKINDRLLVT